MGEPVTTVGSPERTLRAELARLLPYARRHAALFAITLAASVLLAVIDIPIPFFLKKVIDAVLKHHESARLFGQELSPRSFLFGIFVSLLTLAALKAAVVYVQRVVSETIGQRMIQELRLDLYAHLQSLSMGFFKGARTGRLMLRLMGDINAVLDMITDGFLRTLMDVVTIVAITITIVVLNTKLALLVLAGLPLYAWAFLKLSPELRETGRLARRERSELSGHLQETIAGAAVVKAFAQEPHEKRRLASQTERLRDHLIDKARIGGRLAALAHLAIAVGGALTLWIGGGAVLDGSMTKGGLMAFYALAAMLFPPMRRLARTNETFQAARVSLDRILDFFDETTSLAEPRGGSPITVTRGDVAFEGVSFSYVRGTQVLRDVTLRVGSGETVAFVGPNGAGKTTLISLLPRFHDPDAGRVIVDGRDLSRIDPASLRRQVGIVAQQPFLFSGTIADNIRYGKPDASDDEVRDAARTANALGFIETLPDGFDTDPGERGQRLSGGQVQRIALARAILDNPLILILDEATSAVDAESEALIQEAIARLMIGRTTFVIAHRASTVKRADRIVVMELGRIVEEGRHDDLIARRGAYARLFAEQLSIGAVPMEQESSKIASVVGLSRPRG
jgi:ATP-binding cassette, subfamily B, bacterial MsbA